MAIKTMRALVLGVVLASGVANRLRKAAVAVPIVDVTEVVESSSFKTSDYKCCCSKHKGWRDDLRFWVTHSGYCQISKVEKCGGVRVTPQTYIAHSYEDTDGKCELPAWDSFSFEDFYLTHGSPSNYCSEDVIFRTPSDEMLIATASSAALGDEVAYSCPDGWEAPSRAATAKCVFESAHAGRFTGVTCQEIQDVSRQGPKPNEYENEGEEELREGGDEGKDEDENQVDNEDDDENQHQDEDEDGDQKQQDHEEDLDRHDDPSHLPTVKPKPTLTPEDIHEAVTGITEEAKKICRRGELGEFCCIRQCKRLAEENAKGFGVQVKATCVQECSKEWQKTQKS